MTIRQGTLLLALLWLGGCSCHRDPDTQPSKAQATAVTEDASADEAGTPKATPQEIAARRARSSALSAAVSTVHRYMAALPGRTAEADAMWSGGKPAPLPDDANLRSLEGLQGLRVQSGQAVALDRQSPPEAIEVPVHLTAHTAAGIHRFSGWYRLRPRVDGSGWELTSASLQPALD